MENLESKIEEAKHKRAFLIARQKRAEAERIIQQTMAGISDSTALSAFDRIQNRVLDAEMNVEALRELHQLSLEDRFAELNRNNEIEDELARLKAKLNQ